MTMPDDWTGRFFEAFRQTTNGDALAVCNDDGTPISGGGGGGGNGGSSFPINGSASSIAIGASSSLASYTVPAMQTAFVGFNGFGDRYGTFQISVNSLVLFTKILNSANPAPSLMLPKPLLLSTGDSVQLSVTNIGFGSGDYTGTMLFTNTF